MPRISVKSLVAAGGLAMAGGVAVWRRRRANRPAIPAPTASAPAAAPVPPAAAAPEPVRASPPPDAPGPSVTPVAAPETPVERAEAAEAATPDAEVLGARGEPPVDELVERETAAAAAEAAGIGGPGVDDAHGNPAMEAVYEAGGGEAEGFEAAEEALIEHASHGDHGRDPSADAFPPEVEADLSTAVSGDADHEKVSEVVEETPATAEETEAGEPTAEEEAGEGPGQTHER